MYGAPTRIMREQNSYPVDDVGEEPTLPSPLPTKPPCLLYVRIAKTGSSSLMASLGDALGLETDLMCYRRHGSRDLANYKAQTQRAGEQDMYQGHCDFGFHNHVCLPPHTTSRECYYFTWLREPMSRVISSIAYNFRGARGVSRLPANLTRSLAKCFEPGVSCPMEKGANWKNSMTYMLGSDIETDIYNPGEPLNVTRKHLEVAKQRLKNDFVAFGLLEYHLESLSMINEVMTSFGLPTVDLDLRQENAGNDVVKERITKELTGAITKANRLDLELYAYAKTLFLKVWQERSNREFRESTKSVEIHSCSNQTFAL
jgi:hypothetical protein